MGLKVMRDVLNTSREIVHTHTHTHTHTPHTHTDTHTPQTHTHTTHTHTHTHAHTTHTDTILACTNQFHSNNVLLTLWCYSTK